MKSSNVLLLIVVIFTGFDIFYTYSFGAGSKERGVSIIETVARIERSLQRIEDNQIMFVKLLRPLPEQPVAPQSEPQSIPKNCALVGMSNPPSYICK